jgi:hypothetical protein
LVAALGVVAVLVVVPWMGEDWVAGKVEATLKERLGERGLKAEWREVSWNLWLGGAIFRDFSLHEIGGGKRAVVETESLKVRLPPWEWIKPGGSRVTSWKVGHARVMLTDAEGSVALEDVSARVESRRGKIVVKRLQARKDGLAVDLTGEVELRSEPQRPVKPFVMKLAAVRGTLAVLDFAKDQGRFEVKGSFKVDLRKEMPFEWSARLNGGGTQVVWKGVPLAKALAEAELSSSDSVIKAGVSTAHGEVKTVINRTGGWKETPFTFNGTIEDDVKGRDDFRGEYGDRTLTVESLEGNADLWRIAGDVPVLAAGRTDSMEFRRFPEIQAQGIRWNREDGWRMEEAEIRKSGEAVVKRDEGKGREILLEDIKGKAEYRGKSWLLEAVSTNLLGGGVTVSGGYRDGQLSKGKVRAEGLKISEIKRAMGKKKAAGPDGILSLNYAGAARFKDRDFDGAGSVRLDHAPVIEVPLLDEVHDLFASLIPGMDPADEGRFEAEFSASGSIIHVKRFEATGGTLEVSATGEVDLKRETVEGSARGKLAGLPGVVTSPLSRLLEMEVGGKLDHIRVQRLRPGKVISDAAGGVKKVVEEAIQGKDGNGERDEKKDSK